MGTFEPRSSAEAFNTIVYASSTCGHGELLAGVRVLFYATLRDAWGASETNVDADNIRDLLAILSGSRAGVASLLSVAGLRSGSVVLLLNGRTVAPSEGVDTRLSDGDEIALFPAVSGG